MEKPRRIRVGDLVRVPMIWDEAAFEWVDCDKIGIVIAIDEDEPLNSDGTPVRYDRDGTFITIMMDGEVYGHEYYERDLTIIGYPGNGA